MSKGYTGISFPFRVGNRGGIVLSTTSRSDVPHIVESIIQILGTRKKERVMEVAFGSEIDSQIFEINDESSHTLLKFQIVEALADFEPRISVEMGDIELVGEGNKVIANIRFTVLSYQAEYEVDVELGGVTDGQERY